MGLTKSKSFCKERSESCEMDSGEDQEYLRDFLNTKERMDYEDKNS